MNLLAVGQKQRKVVITKAIFYRNTNLEFEFKVLFSFLFLLFEISGARFSQVGAIFF